MLQLVKKIDFRFVTNAVTGTALVAGGTGETGDNVDYDVHDGDKWTNQYILDEQTIGEIGGIELIGPLSAAGVRAKLEYVRLRIDGEEYKHVNLSEMMAPAYSSAEANVNPFFGGSVKVGDGYEALPHSFCHNIGVPMMLGGNPTDAVPKMGPGAKISVEVKAPRAAEGGANVVDDFIVRLSVVQCRTSEMFKKLGEHYGWLSGNNVPQSFKFMDFEENGDIAEYSVDKTVDMSELGSWTEVYGGLDAKKPYIYPYIRYANNAVASTTNEEYTFTKTGSKVLHDEQELDWNFDKREALKLQYIGVDPHPNQSYTRVYIQGRDSNPYAQTPDTAANEYPMPLERLSTPPVMYKGPAALGRGMIIWNTKGNVGVKDNGTAIPAWTTPAVPAVSGANVAVWGKSYKFY